MYREPISARMLIIGCGAIARELRQVITLNRFTAMDIQCLPASYHNDPKRIPAAVAARIRGARNAYDSIFVAYGDCGTGGLLDAALNEYGVERLPGAHCYEFFTGVAKFASINDTEPGTFYMTDYLVRHFDRLVWRGLGLDRWPHLRDSYFGNYRRLIYLSQIWTPELMERAEEAARRLGLAFEHIPTGIEELESAVAGGALASPDHLEQTLERRDDDDLLA